MFFIHQTCINTEIYFHINIQDQNSFISLWQKKFTPCTKYEEFNLIFMKHNIKKKLFTVLVSSFVGYNFVL